MARQAAGHPAIPHTYVMVMPVDKDALAAAMRAIVARRIERGPVRLVLDDDAFHGADKALAEARGEK